MCVCGEGGGRQQAHTNEQRPAGRSVGLWTENLAQPPTTERPIQGRISRTEAGRRLSLHQNYKWAEGWSKHRSAAPTMPGWFKECEKEKKKNSFTAVEIQRAFLRRETENRKGMLRVNKCQPRNAWLPGVKPGQLGTAN